MNDSRRINPARAFTLVELLVGVAIIVILLGILIPASSLVLSRSREASNRALLRTLADGAYAFNQDFRYYPPLLTPDPTDRSRMYAPDHTDSSRPDTVRFNELSEVRWHSVVTPAVYLLGVGSLAPTSGDAPWLNPNHPNYADRHDGADGLGIRNPGPDRSWGGAVMRDDHRPTFTGRVYGPYIDPRIGETQIRPARLTDFTYATQLAPPVTQSHVDMMGLSVIVDRFDEPIRYYKDWPERDRNAPVTGGARVATLRDAPIELVSLDALREYDAAPDSDAPLVDNAVIGKPCVFLSAGADGRWGERRNEALPQDPMLLANEYRSLQDEILSKVTRALEDNERAAP